MDLNEERVQAQLTTQRYGRSLQVVGATGSTNDDARAAVLAGAVDGHVVVADSQHHGRGSRGRVWTSPPGLDLYLSVVARLPLSFEQLPPLTLAVGVALAETVERFLPATLPARVKWPNDIWLGRKKCAGILVESTSMGSETPPVIIGIGLNVNRRVFPDGLDTEPTSLALASELAHGQSLDRSSVLSALLDRLELWVDRYVTYGPAPVVEALRERLALRGELARCDDVVGHVESVSPEGALLLRTEGGVRPVVAGTLRPML